MPTAEILNKLRQYLATSQTFALLAQSEQSTYLAALEKADDSQLLNIMQLMEEEDKKYLQDEQARLEQARQQVEMAEKISKELRESKKIVQQAKEEEDQTQSAALLNQMEDQLKPDDAAAGQKEAPKKKFLGLF